MSNDLRADLALLIDREYDGDDLYYSVVALLKQRGIVNDEATAGVVDTLVYRATNVNRIGAAALTDKLVNTLGIGEVGR